VSDFGDWEPDDAWDREPPDPEQVTYKLHDLRLALDQLAGDQGLPTWDELTADEQEMAMGIGRMIVDYILAREPELPDDLARTLHNARRFMATSRLPEWEQLDADDRQIGIALMSTILDWLRRQGALDAA
jgi:hypothetical protein